MKIHIIEPKGKLQIDGARIIYRNFAGAASKFNREGVRNFSVVIDDIEDAALLEEWGYNVKKKPSRDEEDDTPFMTLPVEVKFNERGPQIYLVSGKNVNTLNEDTVDVLDKIDIINVDLDIRPYDWEVNGKSGRKAYLERIHVEQVIDRFAARYEDQTEEIPFA